MSSESKKVFVSVWVDILDSDNIVFQKETPKYVDLFSVTGSGKTV